MNEKWHTDIVEWNKISLQTASFYVDLAEKRLDETVETSKNASDKNDKLLTLNITLLTSVLTYLSSATFISENQQYFRITLIIILMFLLLQLYFLFKNIYIFKIGTKGEEPRHILTNDFVNGYDGDEQYINLTLHVCEVYQEKINSNSVFNNKRANNLAIAIYLFLGLPISFLLALVRCLF